jgi:ABC-2 type transport system permease protein
MRAAWTIGLKDLKLRVRDRSAFIVGVIAPLGLAFIFSLVLGNVSTGSLDIAYGLVDSDGGQTSQQFGLLLSQLEDEGLFELDSLPSVAAAESAVDDGEYDAVFVVSEGFSDAVMAGASSSIELIGNVDSPTATSIASSIARGFADEIRAVQLAVGSTLTVAPTVDLDRLVQQVIAAERPITIGEVDAATRELDLTTFFVAGMSVFFLFFTVQFGVLALLEERSGGTMPRLLAAPIRRSSIVIGKAGVSVLLGLVSMAILVVASTLLLGADWGDPLAVALLVVAAVFAAVGIIGIVAAFAKTAEGAGNLQAIIAVGLGMLGGIFFPGALGDGWLSRLSYISPHRWFLTGLGDLAGGGGVAVVMPSILALCAFGLVTSAVAWVGMRKAVAV